MKRTAIILTTIVLATSLYAQKTNSYSFKIEKSGAGKPILLIPGLGCSGEVWNNVVEKLNSEYTCIVITLPGFAGQQPIDTDTCYLPKLADELNVFIANSFDSKPILIGHSLGGALAMMVAAQIPEKIEKLIIVDSYPDMVHALNPYAKEEEIITQAKLMRQMIENSVDSIFELQQRFAIQTMVSKPGQVEEILGWTLNSNRATIGQAMFELMTTDLRNQLPQIDVPMLVIGSWAGARDFGVTKEMVLTTFENQYANAPQCKILIAENAKHFIMLDEPDWFDLQVKSFLDAE